MQFIKSISKALLCIALITGNTHAQNWKAKVASEKVGPHQQLSPVHLTYQASFNNLIKAGEIGFVFGKPDKNYPKYYVSQVYGSSYYKLLPYSFDMSSFSYPKKLKPKILIVNEKDDKQSAKITNLYSGNSVKNKEIKNIFETRETKKESYTFKGSNVHDPLTAILFLRSQKLTKGQKIHLCVHPFNSPYYAIATVIGKEKHNGKNCIKLDIALRKINKDNGSLEEYKKLKKATLWFTDDAYRVPLELRVGIKLANHLSIGSARLDLINFKNIK